MAVLDAPRIVTARLEYDDSFTLARYLATGGYDGLRKALTMFPEDVAAEVDEASLLGRGGAGFPAGRKWSMLRKAPISYLVVNGDESEPATFKDHLLDRARSPPAPRGRRDRGLRAAGHAGLHLRARRVRPRPRAVCRLPSTTPTTTARSARRSSTRTSPSTLSCNPGRAPTSAAKRRPSSRDSRASEASRASSRRSFRRSPVSTASPPS